MPAAKCINPLKGQENRSKYVLVDVMTPPDLQLLDDIVTLKAMVLAMAEKAARTDALERGRRPKSQKRRC